jgi:hypothetical protein
MMLWALIVDLTRASKMPPVDYAIATTVSGGGATDNGGGSGSGSGSGSNSTGVEAGWGQFDKCILILVVGVFIAILI